MSGLTVYTTDYTPRLVYADDGAGDRDRGLVERVVRYGDAPLDLLVAFDGDETRVLWSFQGKLGSSASRTGSFVADFRGVGDDPFAAFATALQTTDGTLQMTADDDPQARLGVELASTAAGTPGLTAAERGRLWERLARGGDKDGAPLVFGVCEYAAAQAVIRAIGAAGLDCRVGVASGGDPTSVTGVDLVLVVGSDENFVPLSEAAAAVRGTHEVGTVPETDTTTAGEQTADSGDARDGSGRLPVVVAVAVVAVYLGGTVVLYRGNAALSALAAGTVCGLLATGLLLGAERLARRHRLLAGVVVTLLSLGGVAAGVGALLHMVGVINRGLLATLVAGGYLGFVASFGLYAAGQAMRSGGSAVVPALRSLVGLRSARG